ncbi:hypothetical protein [Streptomyces fulvorobeus]|uniref:hypothetical protein n=1 Tax=Streptomyces fulvorobeus TaxID=284028 RepID=UPI00156429A0|nr:hypothetical protein [Streptomyces fulvorobeus]
MRTIAPPAHPALSDRTTAHPGLRGGAARGARCGYGLPAGLVVDWGVGALATRRDVSA